MASKKIKIIAGNWKMNPTSIADAKELFLAVKKSVHPMKKVETVIFPPFIYLNLLKKLYVEDTIALGAQDVFWQSSGPFTGEISGTMIKSVGGSFCLTGHSERRALGETDTIINKKLQAALRSGLTVILCIGEKERDRDGAYFQFLKDQIKHSLEGVQKKSLERLVIAYEPIFAIGKSDADAMAPRDINEMVIFIRKNLIDHFKTAGAADVRILYGGSTSSKTAKDILVEGKVDGLLVGHQSLDAKNFSEIVKIANEL